MAETLVDQIKVLVDLQKVDGQVHALRRDLAAFPALKKEAESAFATAKVRYAAAEDQLKKLQMKQKELENEILTKETQAKKYQSQQTAVKTNQEYAALTKEIQNTLADKSLIEDQVLKMMDDVETYKKTLQDEKKLLADAEMRSKQEAERVQRESAAVQSQIDALLAERKHFLPQIKPDVLAQYERILAKRDGIAIVPLLREPCGGCSLTFPPQVVNEIKMKETMIFCESCSRIVYEE